MSKKIHKHVVCESCDSEYNLTFAKEMVLGKPDYCPFCSDEVSYQNDEEIDDDDMDEEDDY